MACGSIKSTKRLAQAAGRGLALGLAMIVSSAVAAGELALLPSAMAVSDRVPAGEPARHDDSGTVDLFFSHDQGQLRVLTEVALGNGYGDVERLQAGWRMSPQTSLWFGRFHNPIGYWNTEFHHGRYLETTVGRPRIMEFEDGAGALPIHLFGSWMHTDRPLGEGGSLGLDVAAGSGPAVEGQLEPISLPNGVRWNGPAFTLRATLRPDATLDDQLGLYISTTRIPYADLPGAMVDQRLAGLFVNRDWGPVRLIVEALRVTQTASSAAPFPWPSFDAGYIQGEYHSASLAWIGYLRSERIDSSLNPGYSALFPSLSRQRDVAGIRWDFRANQALKLEAGRELGFSGALTPSLSVQWSGWFH